MGADIRIADRVVREIADRRARAADAAGHVTTSVEAYALGVERRIRSEVFPAALRLLIEHPGLTVDDMATRLMHDTKRRGTAQRRTVAAEYSRHPAWVAERRRRAEGLGKSA